MQLIKKYKHHTLYKYADKIYVIVAKDPVELGMLFLRCQETIDSQKYRKKFFDIMSFISEYQKRNKGVFDYCKRYEGFNLYSEFIEYIYAQEFHKNVYDILLENIHSVINDKNYCLLGVRYGDEETLKHELSHAFYYLDPEYTKAANKLVNELKTNHLRKYNYIIKELKKLEYSPCLFKDEITAYLATNIKNTWRVNEELLQKFKQTYENKAISG